MLCSGMHPKQGHKEMSSVQDVLKIINIYVDIIYVCCVWTDWIVKTKHLSHLEKIYI